MSDCRFGVSPVNYPDPDPSAVTDMEAGDEFYTVPLAEIITAAFQTFNTALFKTNFSFMFSLN